LIFDILFKMNPVYPIHPVILSKNIKNISENPRHPRIKFSESSACPEAHRGGWKLFAKYMLNTPPSRPLFPQCLPSYAVRGLFFRKTPVKQRMFLVKFIPKQYDKNPVVPTIDKGQPFEYNDFNLKWRRSTREKGSTILGYKNEENKFQCN